MGLYPSIPHDEGLESIRLILEVINQFQQKLCSTVNFFNRFRGTAIGTKCAPSYAILFLAALETKTP